MATMVPWIGEATPAEPSGPVGARASSSAGAAACSRLHLGVMREERERIATLDPGAGEPAVVGRGPHRLHEAPPPIRAVGGQRRHVLVDPASVDVAGGEVGMRQDVAKERDVGGRHLPAGTR